jgi:hypothetical protein
MIFPTERYADKDIKPADVRCVILHHPLNWYSQASYHDFRRFLRVRADILLTGHEHTFGAGEIDDAMDGPTIHFEAAALQQHGIPTSSKFLVIELDLSLSAFRSTVLSWNKANYEAAPVSTDWTSYRPLPQKNAKRPLLTDTFRKVLDDPGATFRHPGKEHLDLRDFFVFPDLEKSTGDGKKHPKSSSRVLAELQPLDPYILLTADEGAGKTALLRTLYPLYVDKGAVPVFIDAEQCRSPRVKDFESLTQKALVEQYGSGFVPLWDQAQKCDKILMLDSFERMNIALDHRHAILDIAKERFGRIFVFSASSLEISEIVTPKLAHALRSFTHYKLYTQGYRFRYDLISKWIRIGDDFRREPQEIVSRIDRAEKATQVALVKNLVPRTPIYTLMLLQSMESIEVSSLQTSGIAHYHEYLISQALEGAGVKFKDFHEFFNYLSQLAWVFYHKNCREISVREIEAFTKAYSEEYTLVSATDRIQVLARAGIVTTRGDFVSFKYGYLEHFFLAKYLADRLGESDEIKSEIERHCRHLHVRKHANTLVFLVHHTKDPFVLNCIESTLKTLFEGVLPLDLVSDTGVLNELIDSTAKIVFKDGNPEDYRRRRGALKDELEDRVQEEEQDDEESHADFPSRIVMLLKTVDILGQILKAYYGTLRNERKVELMAELFDAPLRALRDVVELIERNREYLLEVIEESVAGKGNHLPSEKQRIARKILFEVLGLLVSAFVLKAGCSVAAEQLTDVTEKLREKSESVTVDLLALTARLDQPRALPLEEIERLAAVTQDNHFARKILQTIVLRHLYLFPVREREKQIVCSMLDVSFAGQKVRAFDGGKSKLLS